MNSQMVLRSPMINFVGSSRTFCLEGRPQRPNWKNAVIGTDGGVPFNHAMRPNHRARANANIRPDDGVGPDGDVISQLSCLGQQWRLGMN